MLTISWAALGVIIPTLFALAGFALWIVRLVIRAEFDASVRRLNGKYVAEPLCAEREGNVARRLDAHDDSIEQIWQRMGKIADIAMIQAGRRA
jgi:hypothetical protein